MRTAKTLIRLGGCPDWSESSLGAYAILLVLSRGGSFYDIMTMWPASPTLIEPARINRLLPRYHHLYWQKRGSIWINTIHRLLYGHDPDIRLPTCLHTGYLYDHTGDNGMRISSNWNHDATESTASSMTRYPYQTHITNIGKEITIDFL